MRKGKNSPEDDDDEAGPNQTKGNQSQSSRIGEKISYLYRTQYGVYKQLGKLKPRTDQYKTYLLSCRLIFALTENENEIRLLVLN